LTGIKPGTNSWDGTVAALLFPKLRHFSREPDVMRDRYVPGSRRG
jgi:hypothetical protein